MKVEHRVIVLSVLLGIFVWIIDAVLDAFVFYEAPFLQLLITDVPAHEIYIRSMIMLIMVVSGIVASRYLAARNQAEESLRQSVERYRNVCDLTSDWIYSIRVNADESLDLEWTAGAVAGITGYTPTEIDDMGGWSAAIHPDDSIAVDGRVVLIS